MAETGGPIAIVTEFDAARHETSHRYPAFLPDGEHFLFTARSDVGEHSILVGSLSGEEPVRLLNAFSTVAYSDTYILYARNDALMAQPFDAGALELSGNPVSVVEGVVSSSIGTAPFSLSANGVLAYGTQSGGRRLVGLDKTGKELEGHELEGGLNHVRLSRDGKNAAISGAYNELGSDIWLLDRIRGVSERLSFDPSWDSSPVWSPDGRRIAYRAGGGGSIVVIDLDARETDVTKMLLGERASPTDWTPDGRFLIYQKEGDLFALPLEEGEPVPLAETPFDETTGRISPDGRFLAYVSNETSRDEVWVTPFLSQGRRERVSPDGGGVPLWSRDGETLFYLNPSSEVVAVSVRTGEGLTLGTPEVLFRANIDVGFSPWDVLGNDEGFLVIKRSDEPSEFTIVWNWAAELDR